MLYHLVIIDRVSLVNKNHIRIQEISIILFYITKLEIWGLTDGCLFALPL